MYVAAALRVVLPECPAWNSDPATSARVCLVSAVAWLPDGRGLVLAAQGNDGESNAQIWVADYPSAAS